MIRRILWPVILIATALAVTGTACSASTSPPQNSTVIAPSENVLSVGIVVPDQQVLKGWLYGDENDVLVILSHMRPNDQTAWEPFAKELAENGYAVLTYDFRGYGISQGDKDFDKLDDDLAGAVSYMRATERSQIFLIGASMGGTASLVVAAGSNITGVISISAPAEFQGQSAREAMERVSAPVLLIAAEEDTAAMVSLEDLREAATQPPQVLTYAGGEHGTDLFGGEHASDLQEQILQFLDEHAN